MRVFVCMEFQIYFLFLSDDDPDAFDFSPPTTRNVEIKLPLSGCQRKLYDDYLSSSQSKLDSLDAKSIASVLQTLRKVRFFFYFFKVEMILKGSLDSIPSHSPSVKIQIRIGKMCLRCKGKTLLGIVNKLLKTNKFVDITQQCFVLLPK